MGHLPWPSIIAIAAASLGALSLGLDVGMISSTLIQPTFKSFFNNPSAAETGGIVASFAAGATFGAYGCALITDRFGRKVGFLTASIVATLGVALQAGAMNLPMLIAGRLINGLGTGQLTATYAVYASEIAPPQIRGAFGGLLMLMIELAAFIATASGYGFGVSFTNTIQWRGPLAITGIPTVLLIAVCPLLPESPRYLMKKGYVERARDTLNKLHKGQDQAWIDREYQEIFDKVQAENLEGKATWTDIATRPSYRKRIFLCMLLQLFGQLTGINCIKYYAATIYQTLGYNTQQSLLINLLLGAFGLIYGIFWDLTLDKFGRKPILIVNSVMMACAITVQAVLSGIYNGRESVNENALRAQIAMFFIFLLFFVGVGMISWTFPPEILPLPIRAKGTSIAISTNNVCGLVIAQISPIALRAIGFKFFYLFVAGDIVAAVSYWFLFPETKGITLEQMDSIFGDQNMGIVIVEERQDVLPDKSETEEIEKSAQYPALRRSGDSIGRV